MSKTVIKTVSFCERKVNGDNTTTFRIIGMNSKGNRVEVEMPSMPTFILAHIADEAAQCLTKVKHNIQRDIDCVRQSLQ